MMPAMLPLLLTLLCGVATADSPVGTIEGARAGGPSHGEHLVALGLRGGVGFLLGSQGQAYGPGPAASFLLDLPFSSYAGFSAQLGYASHRVVDANPLFEADHLVLPLDADAVTGSQRFYHADVGLRVDLNMSDPTRYRPNAVTVAPWFRFAAGYELSDTLVELSTTQGRESHRTRRPHVAICPSLGVSINLPKLVSFRPSFEMVTLLGIDHDEVAGDDSLRAVYRLQPALDLLFRF
jgi:hypothetical protein